MQPIASTRRFALFALYQFTLAVGLLFLPPALIAGRFGLALPVGRLVTATERAYENAAEADGAD